MSVLLTVLPAIGEGKTEARIKHQKAELAKMLMVRGRRFEHVHVYGDAAGHVHLSGYVRSDEEAAELKGEMLARLGGEVGRTAHFGVIVREDFKEEIERLDELFERIIDEPPILVVCEPIRCNLGIDMEKYAQRATTRPTQGR
jgi:hypothetical protein